MQRIATVATATLALACSVTTARAQDVTGDVDRIFSWTSPEAPGCVVAVSKDGVQVVNRAYGMADLERGVPLSPATVLDIGSVQKQFVAAAVLLLVEDGHVSLSDDVREYFPELPDYGHAITVDHLLTHTSGVRDWVPLVNLATGDVDALTMILRQRDINFAPGEEWSYSNSGFVLLKELIGRVTGTRFAEYARVRLFEPLGMNSTRYTTEGLEDIEDLAPAYEQEGDGWRKDMMLGEERGGGALLSTAGDLLIWNEGLSNARLGAFVSEKLAEPARLTNGRQLSYGRGLFLDSNHGGRVLWHTGSAAAYKAMLVRYPEQGLSIAILCNSGDSADRMAAARSIFDLYVPGPRVAEASGAGDGAAPVADDARPPVIPDANAEGLADRTGLFFSERTGEPMRLVAADGRLRVANGPPLVAVDEDRFRNPEGSLSFMSDDEFELRFVSPDAFELVSMEGQVTRYRRARPWSPTAAELEAFTGRWESDDLMAAFETSPGERGLLIRLNGSPPQGIEFAPVDTDTFQRGLMTLRFRRNADGEIVGLDYSNPALRNVRFTR